MSTRFCKLTHLFVFALCRSCAIKYNYIIKFKSSKMCSHLVEGGAGIFDSDHLELSVPSKVTHGDPSRNF